MNPIILLNSPENKTRGPSLTKRALYIGNINRIGFQPLVRRIHSG